MRYSLKFLILLLNLLICLNASGNSTIFNIPDSLQWKGVKYSLNGEYSRAANFWESLAQETRYKADIFFFKLLNQHLLMVDYEDYTRYQEFEKLMKQFFLILNDEPDGVRKNFLKGAVYFYQSSLLSRQGKWFGAFKSALKGRKLLEKCLEADSAFKDPLIALGAFKYWKSVKAGLLGKLGIIKDERRDGISMLLEAVQDIQNYTQILARDQLSWILINEKKPSEALKLTKNNLKILPESRFLKWTLLAIYEALQDYDQAMKIALELNQFYLKNSSGYNYLLTLNKILNYYVMQPKQYVAHCNINDIISTFEGEKKKISDPDDRTRKYMEEISRLIKKIK